MSVLYAVAYVSLHFGSQVGRGALYLLHDVCRGMRNESDLAETCLRRSVFCGFVHAVAYANQHYASQLGWSTLYLVRDVCGGIRKSALRLLGGAGRLLPGA